MPLLDNKTSVDLVQLIVFILVTSLATAVLVVTHRQPHLRRHPRLQGGVRQRHRRRQGRRHPGRRRQGRHVKDIEIVDRTRALVSFTVDDDTAGQRRHLRDDPLPQPRRPALHLADPGDRRHRPAARGRHDPGRPHQAGAGPHRPVQRLQAALPGAVAGGHQQAVLRDRPGLPGRGRHARGAAAAHRLGDRHARRPRRGHRRPDREPQPGAGPHRRPRRAAVRA